MIQTTLTGWQKYKNHPDRRIRTRFRMKVNVLRTTYAGAVWAMKKWYKGNGRMTAQMCELLQRLCEEFGWTTKLIAQLSGRYIYAMLMKEEKRLAQGWVYEPAGFYKKNAAAIALEIKPGRLLRLPIHRKRWAVDKLSPVRVSHSLMKAKESMDQVK